MSRATRTRPSRHHARHHLGYRLRLRLLLRRSGGVAEYVAATLLVLTCLAHGIAVAWLLDEPNRSRAVGTAAGQPLPTATGARIAGTPVRADAAGPVPVGPVPVGLVPVGPVPVGLAIPAIGVDERTLVTLGRNPDGSLQVPSDYARAGWFTGGPVPGRPGPSVIAGHVDSRAGPAVFFRLRELRAGDVVTVRMSDGGQLPFRVDGVRQYPKANFPTAAVYGPVPGAALRLITCGGSFDRAVRSYRDNVVVYASRQP
ncbi:MAG TPA: class F sortase [Pseudonocardia sp.]